MTNKVIIVCVILFSIVLLAQSIRLLSWINKKDKATIRKYALYLLLAVIIYFIIHLFYPFPIYFRDLKEVSISYQNLPAPVKQAFKYSTLNQFDSLKLKNITYEKTLFEYVINLDHPNYDIEYKCAYGGPFSNPQYFYIGHYVFIIDDNDQRYNPYIFYESKLYYRHAYNYPNNLDETPFVRIDLTKYLPKK